MTKSLEKPHVSDSTRSTGETCNASRRLISRWRRAWDARLNPINQGDDMNEITIRKGTIMKRTTVLVLLALACLMAMPAIAQARYRDGMNLYQYVRSSPTRYVDPAGLQAVAPAAPVPPHSLATDPVVKLPKENKYGKYSLRVELMEGGIGGTCTMSLRFEKKPEVCCDELAIIQFVRIRTRRVNGATSDTYTKPEKRNKKVAVDGFYVDTTKGEPDPKTGDLGSHSPYVSRTMDNAIGMTDAPWAPYPRSGDEKWQEFTTCVTCIKGKDAADGIKTYGCYTWGWYLKRSTRTTPATYALFQLKFSESEIRTNESFRKIMKNWNGVEKEQIPLGKDPTPTP